MSDPGYADEQARIEARFVAEWVDAWSDPLTPIAKDNEHFDAQADGADPATGNPVPWVRLTVFPSDASRASVGGTQARYRHDGEVIVEVFAPLNEGAQGARELADKAASVFRSWTSGPLTFWTPRLVRVGREGSWHRLNVIAPFKRDSVFAHQ